MESQRGLLFEVKSFDPDILNGRYKDRILLSLILGPIETSLRQRIYDGARSKPDIFVGSSTTMGSQYATIFARELLAAPAAKNMTDEEKVSALTREWHNFVSVELPRLTRAVEEIAS